MGKDTDQLYVDLPLDLEGAFIDGARDAAPVKGLTHGYYKYPARFSPAFARAALDAFTEPGDLCLDPHVGGGTTLVEAIASGRNAIGIDISALAEFVSVVKTTIYSMREIERLDHWSNRLIKKIDIRKPSTQIIDYADLGYYKHLDHPSRWRIRKAIEQAISTAVALRTPRLEAFARCAILRTAQWALDGRKRLPSFDEFRVQLAATAVEMLSGARALSVSVSQHGSQKPKATILNRSSAGLELDHRIRSFGAPKLVLTSPPYPGVHVLYHRWQVDGRKEAPLPFMIADKLDGAGGSYYTMGDRAHPGLKTYFENIKKTMSSVAALADATTIIIQMVAFSEPEWQLPRYLETMRDAGLVEVRLRSLVGKGDGRLWRAVPGRRWYSDQRGDTPGSKEVVLLHRKSTPNKKANYLRSAPAIQERFL